jgi:hypothetical protein
VSRTFFNELRLIELNSYEKLKSLSKLDLKQVLIDRKNLSLALSSANYQWFDQVGKKLQVKALAQLVMVKPVCIFIGDTGSPLFSLNFTKTQMTLQVIRRKECTL